MRDALLDPRRIAPCLPGASFESVEGDAVTIRVMIKTAPLVSPDVARELRARLKEAFDDAGIRVPLRPFGVAPPEMYMPGTPMPGASPGGSPPASAG